MATSGTRVAAKEGRESEKARERGGEVGTGWGEDYRRTERGVSDAPTPEHDESRGKTHSLHLGILRLGTGRRLALEERLAVLVELDLGDDNVRGVDRDGDRSTVALVTRDTLDEDTEVLAVRGVDAALAALVGAANDLRGGCECESSSARTRSARGEDSTVRRTLTSSSLRMGSERTCTRASTRKGSAQPFPSPHFVLSPPRSSSVALHRHKQCTATHAVLRAKLLREGRRHDLAADRRRGTEVRLVGLAGGDGNDWVERVGAWSEGAHTEAQAGGGARVGGGEGSRGGRRRRGGEEQHGQHAVLPCRDSHLRYPGPSIDSPAPQDERAPPSVSSPRESLSLRPDLQQLAVLSSPSPSRSSRSDSVVRFEARCVDSCASVHEGEGCARECRRGSKVEGDGGAELTTGGHCASCWVGRDEGQLTRWSGQD